MIKERRITQRKAGGDQRRATKRGTKREKKGESEWKVKARHSLVVNYAICGINRRMFGG